MSKWCFKQAARPRRSPAHGPAERQSPLQTILEDWPELQPPEILAVDGAKKDGADPNQRARALRGMVRPLWRSDCLWEIVGGS